MNLPLAFLHGEQAFVGLVLAGLIALVGVPLLLYVWLWHTQVSEFKLALAYFLLMTVLCGVFGSTSNQSSILSLTVSMLGFILTLPWSVFTSWMLSEVRNSVESDGEFALVMMLSAGINAVLLYFAAVKMRRFIQ